MKIGITWTPPPPSSPEIKVLGVIGSFVASMLTWFINNSLITAPTTNTVHLQRNKNFFSVLEVCVCVFGGWGGEGVITPSQDSIVQRFF